MNFWEFADNQLERIERNGVGLAVLTVIMTVLIGIPILALFARHINQ